jgi:hypothetical protein
MINLNEHQSSYIDQPGLYEVKITAAQDDYTKSGKNCVAVKFETADGKAISCNYVEAVYWKLFRLAQAAGLTEQERGKFEPKMLINRKIQIKVTADDQGRCNVSEAFSVGNVNNSDDMPF